MYLYEAPRAKDMTRLDAAWWIAEQTGITPDEARARILADLAILIPDDPLAMVDYHPNVDPGLPYGVTRWLDLVFDNLPQLAVPGVVEEDAPLMAWWRRWAAEGGSRHA